MKKSSVDKDVKLERREEPGVNVAVKVSSRQNIGGDLAKEAAGDNTDEDEANATAKQSKSSKKERKKKKKKKHSTSSSDGEESDDDNDRAKSKKKATAGVTTRINIFAGTPGAPSVNLQGGLTAPGLVTSVNPPMPMIQQMPMLPMIEQVPMQPVSKRSSKKSKSKSTSAETAQAPAIIPAGAAGLVSGPDGQDVLVIPMPPGMKLPPFGNLNDMYAQLNSAQPKKKKRGSHQSVDNGVAAGPAGTGAVGSASGGVFGGASGGPPKVGSLEEQAARDARQGTTARQSMAGQNWAAQDMAGHIVAGQSLAGQKSMAGQGTTGEPVPAKTTAAAPEASGVAAATGEKKYSGHGNEQGDLEPPPSDYGGPRMLERRPDGGARDDKSLVSTEEDSNLTLIVIFAAVVGIIIVVVVVFIVFSLSGSKSEGSTAAITQVAVPARPLHEDIGHNRHRVVRRHPSPVRNYFRSFRRFKNPVEAYWNIK